MKSIQEYLAINEAWGDRTNYDREMKNIMDEYNKYLDKRKEFYDKKPHGMYSGKAPYEVFKKYPISILVDKLGYEIKMRKSRGFSRKDVVDKDDAARFIEKAIKDEKVTPDQLAKWWDEFNSEVNKKQYFDPEWIVKNIDPTRFFSPYDPDDASMVDGLIDDPSRIVQYLGWGSWLYNKKTGRSMLSGLSQEEKQNVITFYTEPQNLEALRNIFKKARNRFLKARPTLDSAIKKWIQDLFTNDTVEYDGCDLKKELENENGSRTMYSGSNYRSSEAHAICGVVMNALEEVYHLGFTRKGSTSSNASDEDKKKFIADCKRGMRIHVKKGDESKSESGPVSNSSFWTYYKYDIDVEITVYNDGEGDDKYKSIFKKTYKDVTLASDYYSGGWN